MLCRWPPLLLLPTHVDRHCFLCWFFLGGCCKECAAAAYSPAVNVALRSTPPVHSNTHTHTRTSNRTHRESYAKTHAHPHADSNERCPSKGGENNEHKPAPESEWANRAVLMLPGIRTADCGECCPVGIVER